MVPPRTTVARDLFLLQRELIIVSNFFTNCNLPLGIYEDLFLSLHTYNLSIAIRLHMDPKMHYVTHAMWDCPECMPFNNNLVDQLPRKNGL